VADERAEILRAIVRQAPKLASLFSHRYIPGEPNEIGDPKFSIFPSDVVYYGANLANYFENEFNGIASGVQPTKCIRFWSDLGERTRQSPFHPVAGEAQT